MLTKEARDQFLGGVVVDNRFKLINTFELTVPEDYNHATRLDSFGKKHKKDFYFYNDAITDENFVKATTKLVAGRKFKVKVFQITKRVTSENCMAFLRSQKAILTGAQGTSLAWEHAKEELPKGKWSLSFDEKDALWEDADGGHRVPPVGRDSGGDCEFDLGNFEFAWRDGSCLLCFRD